VAVVKEDLINIFKVCGFCNRSRDVRFKMWVSATFERRVEEFTTVFRREDKIKIGLGEHPSRPSDQLKEKLGPPRFRMLTSYAEGKSSRDSLMRLFAKSPTT
jgi:hypothetical protein